MALFVTYMTIQQNREQIYRYWRILYNIFTIEVVFEVVCEAIYFLALSI